MVVAGSGRLHHRVSCLGFDHPRGIQYYPSNTNLMIFGERLQSFQISCLNILVPHQLTSDGQSEGDGRPTDHHQRTEAMVRRESSRAILPVVISLASIKHLATK